MLGGSSRYPPGWRQTVRKACMEVKWGPGKVGRKGLVSVGTQRVSGGPLPAHHTDDSSFEKSIVREATASRKVSCILSREAEACLSRAQIKRSPDQLSGASVSSSHISHPPLQFLLPSSSRPRFRIVAASPSKGKQSGRPAKTI